MAMIEDAFDALMARHPRLFPRPPRCYCDLPAGWLALADRLCTDIEQLAGERLGELEVAQVKSKWGELRMYFDVAGRKTLECDLIGSRPNAALEGVLPDENGYVRSVRATTGGLHFSLIPDDPLALAIAARIEAAERESRGVCEWCGEPGHQMRRGGWIVVACEQHAKEEGGDDS